MATKPAEPVRRISSWPGCLDAGDQTIVTADEIEPLLELPYRRGADHAEGIAVLARSEGRAELLVVYDSPAQERLHDDGTGIDADVFVL